MNRFVLAGTVAGKPVRFDLRPGMLTVGRATVCDLTLPDNTVSRQHAEIELEGDELKVRDLGSTNGTFINSEPVSGSAVIRAGGRLRFGQVTLILSEREVTDFGVFATEGTTPTLTTTVREIRAQASQTGAENLLTALHEAGQMLSKSLALSEVYDQVLELLPRFIKSSRILILSNELKEGLPEILASRPVGRGSSAPVKMSRTMLHEVLTDGRAFVTADAATDARFNATESIIQAGVHAAMAAPLFDNDKILGAVYVDSRIPGITYSGEDLRLLTLLANMIAVKITNSRLEETERETERIRHEISIAARIQRNLLPRTIPGIEGFQVFTHQTPCHEVGGDLFDVRALDDGRIWLVLGDISGKGVGAALLMATVMAGLQVLEDECSDPLELVTRLESYLTQHVEPGQYLTLFAGILDPPRGILQYVNAGHCPPTLLAASGSRALESTGVPVALVPGMPRTAAETALDPGSVLLVFSDGISETECAGRQYEEGPMEKFFEHVRTRCTHLNAECVGKLLLEDVESFRGDAPADDDLTLLVLRREG